MIRDIDGEALIAFIVSRQLDCLVEVVFPSISRRDLFSTLLIERVGGVREEPFISLPGFAYHSFQLPQMKINLKHHRPPHSSFAETRGMSEAEWMNEVEIIARNTMS